MDEIKLEIETQVLIEIAVHIARLLNIWSLDKALIIYWSADCAPCNWKRRIFFLCVISSLYCISCNPQLLVWCTIVGGRINMDPHTQPQICFVRTLETYLRNYRSCPWIDFQLFNQILLFLARMRTRFYEGKSSIPQQARVSRTVFNL